MTTIYLFTTFIIFPNIKIVTHIHVLVKWNWGKNLLINKIKLFYIVLFFIWKYKRLNNSKNSKSQKVKLELFAPPTPEKKILRSSSAYNQSFSDLTLNLYLILTTIIKLLLVSQFCFCLCLMVVKFLVLDSNCNLVTLILILKLSSLLIAAGL